MDRLLENIEKYKFAIIGTALFHIAIFFYVNFSTVERPYKLMPPEVAMDVPLDEFELDPELLEKLDLPLPMPTEEVYNLAADANDTREKSYDDFSTQELDDFDMTSAKDLEKQYFDEWAATHPDQTAKSQADILDPKGDSKTKNPIDQNTINSDGDKAFAGAVMVSFSLDNRKAHSLPRPGYTCNSSGTVVVNIKVDKSGVVKSADLNTSLSSSADECMVEKAIRYAKKSRFNLNSSSPMLQAGTITYKFVSK